MLVNLYTMKYPVTLPYELWMELLMPDNLNRLVQFLEENKNNFFKKDTEDGTANKNSNNC